MNAVDPEFALLEDKIVVASPGLLVNVRQEYASPPELGQVNALEREEADPTGSFPN